MGNSQLEDILRDMEKELVETRGRVEGVNRERKGVQEGARGALEGAEGAWRRGVGELVEVGVAVQGVEREYREELRRKG